MVVKSDLKKEMSQMQLSAIGPKVVTFTSGNSDRDDKRHERVGDAAAATGAAGAGYSATRGAAFKAFRSSENVAKALNAMNQPVRETSSLWNALKVNAKRLKLDIASWAEKSRMPKFMKGMFTGKLGGAIGGVASVFVFVAGLAEVYDAFLHKLSNLTQNN